jgi:hypothetical protein
MQTTTIETETIETTTPVADAPKTETVKIYTATVTISGLEPVVFELAKIKDAYTKAFAEKQKLVNAGVPMKRGGKKNVGRRWDGVKDGKTYSSVVGEATKTIAVEPVASGS